MIDKYYEQLIEKNKSNGDPVNESLNMNMNNTMVIHTSIFGSVTDNLTTMLYQLGEMMDQYKEIKNMNDLSHKRYNASMISFIHSIKVLKDEYIEGLESISSMLFIGMISI